MSANDFEIRGIYPINAGTSLNNSLPILKEYLYLESDVKLPSILFFQVHKKLISDYFLIELSEESFEKSFIEIKDYFRDCCKAFKND